MSSSNAGSGPHEVSDVEARLYYAGVSGEGRGPKLIYRTSEDKFEDPTGPDAPKRLMRLFPVPDDHELERDGQWDKVQDKVVGILDGRNIQWTSIDFVRFTWFVDEEGKPVKENGKRHFTNPTIWIGVEPGTLTGAVAHEAAKDIRAFLDSLPVQNIDIAFRESVNVLL